MAIERNHLAENIGAAAVGPLPGNRSSRTAAPAQPRLSSDAVNVRPSTACTPSVS